MNQGNYNCKPRVKLLNYFNLIRMKIIIALDHHLEYITLRNKFSRIGDIGTTNMVVGKGSWKKQEVGKILASLPNYILSIGTIGFFCWRICVTKAL